MRGMRRLGEAAFVLVLAAASAAAVSGQRLDRPVTPPSSGPRQADWSTAGGHPAADWRTLEVPGYRIHFPAPAEPWARHLAERLPALRARVADTVGWDAPDTVEVVLADPIAQPNGAALALLGRPRLVLLLTPPSASSQLSGFVDWPELLATHEQAHLSHLLRPSRAPLLRLLRFPFGPIPLRSPRWVVEGYATLIEGRLTGSGRPSSAVRASVLRRWAARGQLPSYGALSSDSHRYLGQSMAYLAGSAFLEWLERREGEESLDRLWRRLTARRARGFDAAFHGVFGESPAALWGRFVAELTWQAVEVERRLGDERREGDQWLERSWGTGRPALSRDGARLVVALAERNVPARLAVYTTAPDEEAARRAEEQERQQLARDPEDVAAVHRGAPARRALASLELDDTTVDPSPRFLPDGSVLFARSLPDGEGSYRTDLFRWWPESGRTERLTRHADLRAPDPAPDGSWAVAVESRWGQTRLVRVDLSTGAVTAPWGPASVSEPVDSPRVSPRGDRLALLRHRGNGWELVVRELGGGEERRVVTPQDAAVQDPAWTPAGDALYASIEEDGLLGVQELPLGDPVGPVERRAWTRTPGAAFAAEPAPDGKALYYLSLEPEGLQVQRIEIDGARAREGAAGERRSSQAAPPGGPSPAPLDPAELYPALPPKATTAPPPLALAEVPATHPYGLGHGAWSLLSGGSLGEAGSSVELGVRGGDVVGRWDLLALGAFGSKGAAEGAAVAAAWRGWPVELAAHAYVTQERPSAQGGRGSDGGIGPDGGRTFDLDVRGFELAASWRRAHLGGGLALRVAAGQERLEPQGGEGASRRSAAFDGAFSQRAVRGKWRARGDLDLGSQAGRTAGASWDRRHGRLAFELAHGDASLSLQEERQQLGGRPTALDELQVGGLPTTLLPALATGNRIFEPALPAATLVGRRYEGQRVVATLPGLLLTPFWARHRTGSTNAWSDWSSLAGLELSFELPPLPLVDLPAARLELGAATLLDEPQRGDVNGWVAIVWRP